ncbi:MAG: aromatic amino acid transport family protein [Desulfohalobiaceae bacterium]
MQSKNSLLSVLSFGLLVAGNLIGVGILALPVNTGLAGLYPALLAMLVLAGAMFFSALVLGQEAVLSRQESFNYPSLFGAYLGSAGKWVAILANMLILYGLLVAYITGGTTILANLFQAQESWHWLITILLFAVLTGIALLNTGLIVKYNILIMAALFIFFLGMAGIGELHVQPDKFDFKDWGFLPAAAPIIITAFHFHNIIPNVSSGLNWDFSAVWKAILLGMGIGLAMNALWIQVGIGALPVDDSANSLLNAFRHNQPTTVPMSNIIDSSMFMTCSIAFSLLAITTSYLANSIGLMGFIQDLAENQLGSKSRLLILGLTFLPPLLISMIWPAVFLQAINVVGGVGIVILFGLLPGIIFVHKAKGRGKRFLGYFFLLLFALTLIFEVGKESGLLSIHPDVEHWQPKVEHIKH